MKKLKKHAYSDDEDAENRYEFGVGGKHAPEEKEGEEVDEKGRKKIQPDPDREKASFQLSGKLSEEQRTTESGKILKFVEPPDAKKSQPRDGCYFHSRTKKL